ncbi:MAG: class I SAM-dependent methyltransferase [Solirubrobacteraceae bacterium]
MRSADPDLRCPACGAALIAWRSVPASEPALGRVRFGLALCPRCGCAVTAGPAPAQLHDSGAYRDGAPRLHGIAKPALRAFDHQRLALLAKLVAPPARLLDAGAGRGRFVAAAAAAGYDASGIEPWRRGAGGAAIAAPVQRVSIEQAEVPDASLDVVTLWHVLEHLADPGAALAAISAWLRPGGSLLVGVPNLASVQSRLGGDRWYHLDVPRHRVHFTPEGLTTLLGAHGFTVLHVHHVLLEHNPFGMWQSLVNRATTNPSYLYNLLKRNASWHSSDLILTALAMPLAPLAALGELIAGLARRGGTIAVLARRADHRDGGASRSP